MSRFQIKSIAVAALTGLALIAAPMAAQADQWPHGRPGPARAAPQRQAPPQRVFQQQAPRVFQQAPRVVQQRVYQPRVFQQPAPQQRFVQQRFAPQPRFVQPPQPRYIQRGFGGRRFVAPRAAPGGFAASRWHFAGRHYRHVWHGRYVWFGLPFPAIYTAGYIYDDCWQSVLTPWGWGWINICDPYWSDY